MEGDLFNVLNNLDSDHLDSIDTKLSDAINLYARKSQVEELFKGYVHAFNSNEHDVLWMPKTLKSFRSCCKALHFETVIRVWIILNDELKKATSMGLEDVDKKKLFPVLRLFTEFINSICLSQVPQKALIQIVNCILTTQEMAVGFIELCLGSKNASHMTHFLHLLTMTGELIFEFPMIYQQFLAHSEPCQGSKKLFSICSIIVGFSDEKAAKVHAFMISQPDKIAFFAWLNLLIFKVKCSSLNVWNNEALISLCDFIILDLLGSMDFDEGDEYVSLFWSTICRSYHSIFEASLRTNNPSHQNYNSTFSKKLVQSLCQGGTYQDITKRFFCNLPNGDATSDLLNELCSQFLEKLCEIFNYRKKKSKKMKNGLEMYTIVTIMESLNQTLPQLMESSTHESISSGLQSLLDESIALLSNMSQESISYSEDLLNVMDALLNYLVPFMNRLQKMKCSIISIMILCRGIQDLRVSTRCLLIVANSLHHIKCTQLLLKYISPATFCSWVLCLYDHFSSNEEDVILCRKLCKRIFDFFMSAVLKSVAELKKTKGFFKKICKDDSICNFEHLLMTNNLVCKALNQQSIDVECSSVLKKIGNKLLLKTYSSLESHHDTNEETGILQEDKKCLPLIMETMVSLLRHSKTSVAQRDEENNSSEMNTFKQVLKFKDYSLTIIKSTEDPEILLNSINFIKEICFGQSDDSQSEFLDKAFDVTCQKLRNLVESKNLPSSDPLKIQLSELACQLLLSMNKEKISIALEGIFSTLDSKAVNWCSVQCIMQIWQSLLDQKIGESIEETMIYSCQHIVNSIQKLLLKNPPAYATVSMLNTMTVLIHKKPNFLLIQDLSIILHFAHSVNLETFPSKSLSSTYKTQLAEFVAVFQSYYKVLDSILSSHSESVKCLIPTFTAAAKKLLQASMWSGQQIMGITLNQDDLQDLEKCARSVERLAASMQEYKLDFTKVSHLFVAEFADCSQKVTLYPVIKMPLLQAVYSWLDMCDEHTTAQLQIALSAGAKEIYRDIYNEFTRYHKYKG